MNDIYPWDVEQPSIHLRVKACINGPKSVRLSEATNDNGERTAVSINVIGEGFAEVSLSLGVGWPTDQEIIENAGRLINLLEQAQENARSRIAARLLAAEAVPA